MPRAKTFDPDVVLERAMEVFRERGYEGTSLADLLAATGIGRQSLYDTWGDKRHLFLAALDRFADERLDPALGALETGQGIAAIARYFRLTVAGLTGNVRCPGCFMVQSLVELAPSDAEVAVRSHAYLHRLTGAFRRALETAEAGGVALSAPAADHARVLAATVVGLGAMARAGLDARELERIPTALLSGIVRP